MARRSLVQPRMTPKAKGHLRHLTGETLREIGVLVIVFTPLDALFARDALAIVMSMRSATSVSVS